MADAPKFDAARLIADLRAGDPQALDDAYRATFCTDMGRLVLADFMSDMGVGRPIPIQLGDGELRQYVGQHNAALALAAKAGFDQSAIVAQVLSENLEGNSNDRRFNHDDDRSDHGDFSDWSPGPNEEF